MNTTLTEHTTDEIEELRKDYYDEYYPSPRVEKAIFNYLDQDYYASEDDVFYTIYKKENDWFVNREEIEKEITNMFGLTLPERIKVGPNEDDYIQPARNPIPGRVIHKWIVKHQLDNFGEKEEDKEIAEDLENWGFDGKEIGPLKEDKMNLCDKLTVNNEKEIRDGMEGMTIPSKDKKKIEDLIGKMNNQRKKLGNNLDISNNYLHRIQNILCTFSPEDKENIKQPHPHIHEQHDVNPKLINKFLKEFWPQHRSQLYSQLYNTYHPSAYSESFIRPSSNFENALETLAVAVHEGKKLGLIDSSVDWSDIVHYDEDDYSTSDLRVIDDNGIPTLNNQLEILDNTNLDWIHGILLFDVLEDIVDEFKSYCGENGVDESGMGKCMGEFPPSPDHEQINRTGGTLKQDYYTLFNFMRDLDRAGIPVREYMRSPLFPSIIKLVDDGTTDYNSEGGDRNSADWENMRTQTEFEMDAPDRIYEQEDYPGGLDKKEKALEIKRVKDEIETNKKVIKNMEDNLKQLEPKPTYGPSSKKDDEDKPSVIGIGTAYYANEQSNTEDQTDASDKDDKFKDFKIDTELSSTSKDLEKAVIQGNIDFKKTQNQSLEKKLTDLKKPVNTTTDSTNTMSQGDGEVDPTKTIKPLKVDKVVKDLPPLEKAKITEHEETEEVEVDNTPFTRKEVLILKTLHKNLTKDQLYKISDDTPQAYGATDKKFWNIMKLFGIEETNTEQNTRESRYAKWAYDNWTEDGDYGNIENPIKAPLAWYNVERDETGSQVEYKSGEAEVLGFDEDDAGERADDDFYAWGGEMETNDYGDYEQYDSEITNSQFIRMDESKKIVKVLREQSEKEDFNELMYEVLRRVRQIPLDKTVSPRRIKEILSDDGVGFDLNNGANLNEEIHREYNRVRFYEYSQQLLKASHSKGVRGHYFEGLLAGLFNGQVVSPLQGEMTDPKEDVLIGGINYSAKLVRAQDKKWGTSSLLGGFKQALIQRLVDREIEISDELLKRKLEVKSINELIELFPENDPDRDSFQIRHMELFLKDPSVDRRYKEITMDHAFTSKSEEEVGIELHWIFGLIWGTDENFEGDTLPTTHLKYYLIDTPSLIDGILDGDIHFTKGRNVREIRISEKSMIQINGAISNYIKFPVVTLEDLKKLLYDENSEEMVYKVMGIFKDFKPGTEKYMHHKIADVIADNPQKFIKRLQDLFPTKNITEETLHRVVEDLDPALKYSIDQQYRTNPELKDELLQSIGGEEAESEYHLNPEEDSPVLDVPPIKIAQKFSDVNGYGQIKFDMQGGNGIAYFTDKDLVIKLTADGSEYHTANKLIGTDNEYIVKVIESAQIKTSHSSDLFYVIVEEALPMTEEMENIWSECCCGVDAPVHIDYMAGDMNSIYSPLVLPPVSEHEKCLPIYDNIIGIQKNFAEYGITWSDIGIDNMGIKNGKLAVVDLGETRGQGSVEGKILTLEHINIRPLSSKQIKKQLVLI